MGFNDFTMEGFDRRWTYELDPASGGDQPEATEFIDLEINDYATHPRRLRSRRDVLVHYRP